MYGAVWRWNPATGQLEPATQAEAGQSYWVEVTAHSTWTPALPSARTTTMRYDGDGGRVQQRAGAETTTYLGDLAEWHGTAMTKHLYAGARRLASVTQDGAQRTVAYYHGDHLGSSHVVTDAAGTRTTVSAYTPYGELTPNAELSTLHFGFTGQRFDPEPALYFYSARYYNPTSGRFISPDPFVQAPGDPQFLNRYAYVRNNPVRYVDPSGLAAEAGAAAAMGNPIGIIIAAIYLIVWAALKFSKQQSDRPSNFTQLIGDMGERFATGLTQPAMAASGNYQPPYKRQFLPVVAATAIAIPDPSDAVIGTILVGGAATVAATYGAKVLHRTLTNAIPHLERTTPIVVGYHATAYPSDAARIHDEGFDLDFSDSDSRNRFGTGFYLASTPEGAVAELAVRGLTVNAMLEVRARLTRNIPITGPLAERPISRWVGAAIRLMGGSITYGSTTTVGVSNYVLFSPMEQVVSQRVIRLGHQ